MAKIDEVSSTLGHLNAKVDMLVGMKSEYDRKIENVDRKLDDIHTSLTAANLPELKQKVERMEKQKWLMLGTAAGGGAAASGGLSWLKGILAHLL